MAGSVLERASIKVIDFIRFYGVLLYAFVPSTLLLPPLCPPALFKLKGMCAEYICHLSCTILFLIKSRKKHW